MVGSARVRLGDVKESIQWGSRQQLQLAGHKVDDGAGTMLELQLFLSTVSQHADAFSLLAQHNSACTFNVVFSIPVTSVCRCGSTLIIQIVGTFAC